MGSRGRIVARSVEPPAIAEGESSVCQNVCGGDESDPMHESHRSEWLLAVYWAVRIGCSHPQRSEEGPMRKALVLLLALALAVGGTMAVSAEFAPGPAPNSHDGIPDGSGWDVPPGPLGPAPTSGDGISASSGF